MIENQKKKKKKKKFFQIGIFCLELGKKHTFWHWEWGRISAPKSGDREPCIYMNKPNRLSDWSIQLKVLHLLPIGWGLLFCKC